MVKICSKCRSILPVDKMDCPKCGNKNLFIGCNKCNKILTKGANSCPICGDKILGKTEAEKISPDQVGVKKAGVLETILTFSVAIIISLIIIMFFGTSNSNISSNISMGSTIIVNKDSYGHDETWARAEVHSIVSSHLKAPSTAKFPWPDEEKVSRSGDTWTVSGWVDAQNSFGAMIRSNYVVKITSTSENTYKIVSCLIE